jgi:hypothetical protein
MKHIIHCILLGFALTTTSLAVPFLQLDIGDGVYGADETIYNTTDPFTLYALVNSASSKYEANRNYYLSIAIVPQVSSVPADFGSFDFNGTTYSGSNSGWTYGTPPADAPIRDLPGHGIYDTMFLEIAFSSFTGTTALYNSEDNPGGIDLGGSGSLLYRAFNLDTRNLGNYAIHFDLYTYNNRRVDNFAPFSHDAESRQNVAVPDGGMTALLLGVGCFALSVGRRILVQA